MKLIKLVNKDYMSGTGYDNPMSWKVGVSNKIEHVSNPELCTEDVIHAYTSVNQALLFNPIHSNYSPFHILECEGEVQVKKYDKIGTFELKVLKELDIPAWYKDETTRRKVLVQFAILCASEVLPIFENKYPNDNRPRKAIEAAQAVLDSNFSAESIEAATNAYYTVFYAAAAAANAYYTVFYAAYVAASHAANAAHAARAAACAREKDINLEELMQKAIEMQGI